MLKDTMPLLTTLTVNTSNEMNLTIARRFRDIASLAINSVYTVSIEDAETPEEFYVVNMKRLAVCRFVPFIGQFDKLKAVEVGGTMDEDGSVANLIPLTTSYLWEEGEGYPHLADRDLMLLLIDNVTEGYKSGALSRDTTVLGLWCPDAKDRRGQNVSNCGACKAAAKAYPLECVSRFDSRGSSTSEVLSGRSFFYDCCLSRSQIDGFIEERPGGKEVLEHEDRFLLLLSRGRRFELPPDDKESLHIVEYTETLLEDISRAIANMGINKKSISASKVTEAIFRSFRVGSCGQMPPMNRCLLASTSLEKLNELGLPLVVKDLDIDLEDLRRHADQITKATVQGYTDRRNFIRNDIDKILPCCLGLICRIVLSSESQIRGLCELDLIVGLQAALNEGVADRNESVKVLKALLTDPTTETFQLVAESSLIRALCNCTFARSTSQSNPRGFEATLSLLVDMTARGDSERCIKNIADTNFAISGLVGMLEKTTDVSSDALAIIVALSADHFDKLKQLPNLMRKVAGVLERQDSTTTVLLRCSMLLSKGLKNGCLPTATVLLLKLAPCIVGVMKRTEDTAVHANLLPILSSLALGPWEAKRAILSPNYDDAASIVVSSLESSSKLVVGHAITIVALLETTVHFEYLVRAGLISKIVSLLRRGVELEVQHDLLEIILVRADKGNEISLANEAGLVAVLSSLSVTEEATVPTRVSKIAICVINSLADQSVCLESLHNGGALQAMLSLLESAFPLSDEDSDDERIALASTALIKICSGLALDFEVGKRCLATLQQMARVATDDGDLVFASSICVAICKVLSGRQTDEMKELAAKLRVVAPVLVLASSGRCNSALGVVELMSKASEEGVESILSGTGLQCLKKALAASDDEGKEAVCRIISNLVIGSQQRIQAVIDEGFGIILHYLVQMLLTRKGLEPALETIQNITMSATAEQVKSLVDKGCVRPICNIIESDCTSAASTHALGTLEYVSDLSINVTHFITSIFPDEHLQILRSAVQCCAPNPSNASDVEFIQTLLSRIADENAQIKQTSDRMKGMKKKKIWIECENQKRIVKTLDDSVKFLRSQNVEVQNNLRSVEANLSLGQSW